METLGNWFCSPGLESVTRGHGKGGREGGWDSPAASKSQIHLGWLAIHLDIDFSQGFWLPAHCPRWEFCRWERLFFRVFVTVSSTSVSHFHQGITGSEFPAASESQERTPHGTVCIPGVGSASGRICPLIAPSVPQEDTIPAWPWLWFSRFSFIFLLPGRKARQFQVLMST